MLLESKNHKLLLADELIELSELAIKQGGVIASVWRSAELQRVFYMQGRKATSEVNEERKKLGLREITPQENRIITGTLRSRHMILCAVDIWFKGKIDTYRTFYNSLPESITKKVLWGGYWHVLKDYMHFELKVNSREKLNRMYEVAEKRRIKDSLDLLSFRTHLLDILF